MASTFFGLHIAASGLNAYQTSINTTAHNLTNSRTEGYSRQQAIKKAATAIGYNASYGTVGGGVQVTGIEQIRDSYYDKRFRENNSQLGGYNAKSQYLTMVQDYFNESKTDGLSKDYENIFTSMKGLSGDGNSPTLRNKLISSSDAMMDNVNGIYTKLEDLQASANDDVKNKVNQINNIAKEIYNINKQINTIEVKGQTANDLRDQRELLIDKLSSITEVEVVETKGFGNTTNYEVSIDGRVLVDNSDVHQLVTVPRTNKNNQSDIGGLYDIRWDREYGPPFTAKGAGELKSLLEVRDGNNNNTLKGNVALKEEIFDGFGVATGKFKVVINPSNLSSTSQLGIPASGKIIIGGVEYSYEDVATDADGPGTVTLIFDSDPPIAAGDAAFTTQGVEGKGIPFYQQQMNEFVRSLAKEFNTIHKTGVDINKDPGLDYFTANGQPVTNYYAMTGKNVQVNQIIQKNPDKLVTQTLADTTQGDQKHSVLDALQTIKTNNKLFAVGSGDSFLQNVMGHIAEDTQKVLNFQDNQKDVLNTIINQKASYSGVEENEEYAFLIQLENGFKMSGKLMSMMDELYDVLIKQTGV